MDPKTKEGRRKRQKDREGRGREGSDEKQEEKVTEGGGQRR